MKKERNEAVPLDDRHLDRQVRQHLKEIEQEEETPERLLTLARQLQRLLRVKDG